MLVRITLY